MKRLNIKPLSVNDAWQGRRFKSPAYKQYERDMLMIMPRIEMPDGELKLSITFGFSNKSSDIDNPLKMFIDILQAKYKFNDSRIVSLIVNKVKVEKGMEYIDFNIGAANEQ